MLQSAVFYVSFGPETIASDLNGQLRRHLKVALI